MHPRQDGGGEACTVCGGPASGRTTLTVYDQTVFVAVALCSTCLTALTATKGIDDIHSRPSPPNPG